MSRQLKSNAIGARASGRGGVILLVVLALLALFTLMGLTLVMATAQARMSALNSARAQRSGTPSAQLLSRAFHDVVRGTTNPRSPIQAHGIVEDLYGSPILIGAVSSVAGTGSQLLRITYAGMPGVASNPPYVLPLANYVFTGLVITMRDGTAQNRSARIVADTYNALTNTYVLYTTTFESTGSADGSLIYPKGGDTFVINGRPFAGTGFGFQLASFYGGNPIYGGGTTYKLDAVDPTPYSSYLFPTLGTSASLSSAAPQFLWPYALLPNHAHFMSQNPSNANIATGGGYYTDAGGPGVATAGVVLPMANAAAGGANEPYDAVDYQNMHLAMHYFDTNAFLPSIPVAWVHPPVLTPEPSFHRSALFAYWSQYFSVLNAASPTLVRELRRKIMLRPDPADQAFVPFGPQDLNSNGIFEFREPFTDLDGNGFWTAGEPWLELNGNTVYDVGDLDFTGKPFNPVSGPYCIFHDPASNLEMWVQEARNPSFPASDWDVDNDNDGFNDSIWLDLGYEPEQGPDGRLYKPLFAILCVDMDGKLNLNAHGNVAQVDALRYNSTVTGPFFEGASSATSGTLATNVVSRNFTFGEGVGPAEVSLLPVLARTGPGAVTPNTAATLQYYQQLLQGTYLPSLNNQPPRYVNGRNGEVDDPYLQLAPGAVNPTVTAGPNNVSLLGGPMPGKTMQFDPFTIYVNDPLNQARQFLDHPWLVLPATNQPPISPGNSLGIFFDFMSPNFVVNAYTHVPTGYGSPYNLHGRGSVLLDLRGQPYYAGTATFPWMAPVTATYPTLGNVLVADTVDDPYEQDFSLTAQRDGMIVNAAGNITKHDAPFTPEELERVLRAFDVDAQSLPSRLNDLLPLNPVGYGPADPTLALGLPAHSQALTTDSFDLPVPGVTATHLTQVNDLMSSSHSVMAYQTVPTTLGGTSIVDLARSRIMQRNGWTAQQADLALFGSMMMGLGSSYIPVIHPLLAPELVQGMRVDINRAFGNGTDDNLNGVVDEPAEVPITGAYLGESLSFPLAGGGNVSISLDLNNDGLSPSAATDPAFFADARGRQLLARHLYVTMMLLIEDLNLPVQIFETTSASPEYAGLSQTAQLVPGSTTQYRPAQQLAYFVAQWAINVVDFRDPDSIMTPFEFDMDPFYNDDGNMANGTWDVDDRVWPTSSTVDPWTMQGVAPGIDPDLTTAALTAGYRGLVWGCERPELLITETMAIHDRGTADTSQATDINDPTQNQPTGPDTVVGPKSTLGTPPNDQTYDQVRRPRGSIIVELFNPNSPLSAPQADMLQGTTVPVPSTGGVNLTQYTVGPNGMSPVWRLAVAYSPAGYDAYTTTAPAAMSQLDPRVPTVPSTYVHRVAYFTPLNPAAGQNAVTDVAAYHSFFPDYNLVPLNTPVVVQPNGYALVAPGVVDPRANAMSTTAAVFFGARNSSGDTTVGPNGKQNLYQSYLNLNGGGGVNAVGMYNDSGAGPGGGVGVAVSPFVATVPQVNIKNVVGLPLATLYLNAGGVPVAPAASSTSVRFSLSEPETGYPYQPGLTNTPMNTSLQYWDDGFYFLSGTTAPTKYPNIPFDHPSNSNGIKPNPNVSPDGTILNYTNIYLQRLANPLAPWDATANPYITVDSMPLDLTSYTGESTGAEPTYGGAVAVPSGMAFDARSRGDITALASAATPAVANAALDVPNIWTPASTAPTSWTALSTKLIPLQYSTFGFLNQTYWVSSAGISTGNKSNTSFLNGWTSGFYSAALTATADASAYGRLQSATTNATGGTTTGIAQAQYYGDPLLPFPWLVWNNRPYISQYELMLVPASSPSTLLSDFGLLGYVRNSYQNAAGQTVEQWMPYSTSNPYNPPAGYNPLSSTGTAATLAVPLGPFQQLLNFYDSALTNGVTTRTASSTQPANFFRIFEYLNVPSPYTGTQTLLNPAAMSGVVSGLHWLHPPFNWVSQYREPGRINLNTVFDPAVFQGLLDDYPQWVMGTSPSTAWQSLWQGLVDSRRGSNLVSYNAVNTPPYSLQTTLGTALPNLTLFTPYNLANSTGGQSVLPTYTANPFRPEGAATLVPPVMPPPTNPSAAANLGPGPSPTLYLSGQEINSTLLRSTAPNSYVGTMSGAAAVPLFSAKGFDTAASSDTYLATTGNAAWRQTARNAYFQYQAQQRLGNLVTNRSNVFAVWLTVGYFEALPVLPSSANPDGYQLGPEKGSDSGSTERHRAFYMFDRSIPIGFQRGEDLNVDNGIITQRIIE